jgi:hypothetical protein
MNDGGQAHSVSTMRQRANVMSRVWRESTDSVSKREQHGVEAKVGQEDGAASGQHGTFSACAYDSTCNTTDTRRWTHV